MHRVVRADGQVLLLEHGKSPWFPLVNWWLDYRAPRHLAVWGCAFNRDILEAVEQSDFEIKEKHTKHLGTTQMFVLAPSKTK